MLRLLKLKLIELLSFHWLIAAMLILPLFMGLISGTANLANRQMDVSLAIVDDDMTAESSALIDRLQSSHWQIQSVHLSKAWQMLYNQQIDGIITIEKGYAESLFTLDNSKITLNQAQGSLVTTVVRESIASAVLPDHARIALLQKIEARYSDLSEPVPADLVQKFNDRIEFYAGHDARMILNYIGQERYSPLLTYVISDYSLQVLFLSIYAVMGVLLLTNFPLRRRLATTKNGLLLDYCLSLSALFLLGLVQIIIFSSSMSCLMQTALRLSDLFLLAVFLLLLLGLGQLLFLINAHLRLFIALLLMILSATVGGSFFHLPEILLRTIGQYTPHGWVLSKISGYSALPSYWPISLALVLLISGYFQQKQLSSSSSLKE